MKKQIIISWFIGMLLWSCSDKKEEKIKNLEAENQQLEETITSRDSTIQAISSKMENLETQLSEISERLQVDISMESDSISGDPFYTLTQKIKRIDVLMAEDKKRISQLNSQITHLKQQNNEMSDEMGEQKEKLEAKIAQKEELLAVAVEDLRKKESIIVDLKEQIASIEAEKDQLASNSRVGYYITGDFKNLEEKNIVDREGGLLFIGRTEVIQDNFEKRHFKQIDISEKTSIPVEGEKVELVSTHGTGTYQIKDNVEGKELIISNPQKFWEKTRYMVMLVKK